MVEINVALLATLIYICTSLNLIYMSTPLVDRLMVLLALCTFFPCQSLLESQSHKLTTRLLIFCIPGGGVVLINALYLFPVVVMLVAD